MSSKVKYIQQALSCWDSVYYNVVFLSPLLNETERDQCSDETEGELTHIYSCPFSRLLEPGDKTSAGSSFCRDLTYSAYFFVWAMASRTTARHPHPFVPAHARLRIERRGYSLNQKRTTIKKVESPKPPQCSYLVRICSSKNCIAKIT